MQKMLSDVISGVGKDLVADTAYPTSGIVGFELVTRWTGQSTGIHLGLVNGKKIQTETKWGQFLVAGGLLIPIEYR